MKKTRFNSNPKILPYLKSSFKSQRSKNTTNTHPLKSIIKSSKSAFSLIYNSRLSTNPESTKLQHSDSKIIHTLRKKYDANTLGETDILTALEKSSLIENKMKILDIAVKHKEEIKEKKRHLKQHFTFQKHIFLIVKFINSLKSAVKKKRKERQLAFEEGILPVLRTAEKKKKISDILEKREILKERNIKVGTKRKKEKELSVKFQTHQKLFKMNKNAYTLDLAPKSSIIEEVEIPVHAKGRIDSPTLRKSKSHFQKVRIQNQNMKKIQISIHKMKKIQLRSEILKRKTERMIMMNKNRNKRFSKFKKMQKNRAKTEETFENVDKMKLFSGLLEEEENDELNKKVIKTFLSSLNKLKKLHDLAEKRDEDFVNKIKIIFLIDLS